MSALYPTIFTYYGRLRRRRRSVTFRDEAAEIVERLAAEQGVPVAEAVRRAVVREQWYQDLCRAGGTLYAERGTEFRQVQFTQDAP